MGDEDKVKIHDMRLDALSTKMDKLMKEMNKMQSTLNDINIELQMNGIFAKMHEEDVSNGSEWLRMDQKLIIIKFCHILFCFVLFFFFIFDLIQIYMWYQILFVLQSLIICFFLFLF